MAIAVAGVALTFVTSAPAVAATVAVTPDTPEGPPTTLVYRAAPGEANDVTITTNGAYAFVGWLVSDTGAPLTAGARCTALDAHTASCPFTESEINIAVDVDLGDLNDYASVAGACGAEENEEDFPCAGVTVNGGSGLDIVFGSDAAPSTLYGGEGDDHLLAGERGAVLDGGPGDDWLIGAAGRDRLLGRAGDDRLDGHAGNDVARGGDDADRISGGWGHDIISGGPGRDDLRGGPRDDTIYARDGYRDDVNGGMGRDQAGIDRGRDRVRSIERIRR